MPMIKLVLAALPDGMGYDATFENSKCDPSQLLDEVVLQYSGGWRPSFPSFYIYLARRESGTRRSLAYVRLSLEYSVTMARQS